MGEIFIQKKWAKRPASDDDIFPGPFFLVKFVRVLYVDAIFFELLNSVLFFSKFYWFGYGFGFSICSGFCIDSASAMMRIRALVCLDVRLFIDL